MFESFLHTRYKGEKRFSLEGGETLIPMLWYALESGGDLGMMEVVLGISTAAGSTSSRTSSTSPTTRFSPSSKETTRTSATAAAT